MEMRLRPYIEAKDFEYVKKWVNDERVHYLWCAGLIPYPLSKESFRAVLDKDEREWGGCAYVVTKKDGSPVGFFVYSINDQDDSGFLRFVVLNKELRGKGYGTEMLKLALKYALEITGVSSVGLNVFDVNISARKCYMKAGFNEESITKDVFSYKGEQWGRCRMIFVG